LNDGITRGIRFREIKGRQVIWPVVCMWKRRKHGISDYPMKIFAFDIMCIFIPTKNIGYMFHDVIIAIIIFVTAKY
jgi:hypothetical protein